MRVLYWRPRKGGPCEIDAMMGGREVGRMGGGEEGWEGTRGVEEQGSRDAGVVQSSRECFTGGETVDSGRRREGWSTRT